MSDQNIHKIRRAVAEYIASEGCSCCRGKDHDKHAAQLAQLLGVPQYEDGSGFDFYRFLPKRHALRRGAYAYERTSLSREEA
jgi:hypothetical protein